MTISFAGLEAGRSLKIVSMLGPRRRERLLVDARVGIESKSESLWKSVSSSSPDVKTRGSSDPITMDARSEVEINSCLMCERRRDDRLEVDGKSNESCSGRLAFGEVM